MACWVMLASQVAFGRGSIAEFKNNTDRWRIKKGEQSCPETGAMSAVGKV